MEHWFILPVATQGQITKGFFFVCFLLSFGMGLYLCHCYKCSLASDS